MGLLARVARLVRKCRRRDEHDGRIQLDGRTRRFETMEPRRMLAADLLQVGAVFTEADLGSDLQGDTFEVTFEGGAPGTQLTRLVIDGDQDDVGFGEGDVFFDNLPGGFGADNSFPFTLLQLNTANPDATVQASITDGQSQLVLDLTGFQAGDKLLFSVDVDEVEDFDPDSRDLDLINEGFDPITSGVEFQGSRFTAQFSAPHYHAAGGTGEFRNRYDDALAATNLDLPADNDGGLRDRRDGVVVTVEQQPLPISIAGTVFLDHDLNLQQDPAETGLADVELSLWKQEGAQYQATGHTTHTDEVGNYEFGFDLNLLPGTYQVREVQPPGLYSVGAIAGTVAGRPTGVVAASEPNRLSEIAMPLGGERAINYDFAEARPAALSGYVFHDRNDDGRRDQGEEGLANVIVDLVPVDTIAAQAAVRSVTDSTGYYEATGLAPGTYRVVEVQQPTGFFDGLDSPGRVDGQLRGTAVNPGDSLEEVLLRGGDVGVEYNFGELAPVSLSGAVHLSTADGDCFSDGMLHPPLADVVIRLLDGSGTLVAETMTDASGEYRFEQLMPGEYSLMEVTPQGLLDGSGQVGTVLGSPRGRLTSSNQISAIVLASGQHGTGYDFCEHAPGSLSGYVYHDANHNGVMDGQEVGLGGAVVTLLDADRRVVAQDRTSSDGFYRFDGLAAGEYTIREQQPEGWLDGLDAAGTIQGAVVGRAENPGDRISDIQLRYGEQGVHYDFGELAPVKIGGFVYHDRNNNGIRDADEEGIGGAQLRVIPVAAQAPQEAVNIVSSADGMYMTGMIAPGRYRIVQVAQPEGYFDGLDSAGTVNGQPQGSALNPGDAIESIELGSGETGMDFNFGELRPASIAGSVHLSDGNGVCFQDGSQHLPVAGAELFLLNEFEETVASTTTDSRGEYRFDNLLPGSYTVVEQTPAGLLDGGERVGRIAGRTVGEVVGDDRIGGIVLLAGDQATSFDFCEHAPGSLSGYVYHDANHNGVMDGQEVGLGGAVVTLLDADRRVVAQDRTSSDGFYRFDGLAASEYTIREQQPEGWLDGLDAAGTIQGAVVGRAENPGDRISDIQLRYGEQGVHYDFGELAPVKIGGFVYHDRNNNGIRDADEEGIGGAQLRVIPVAAQAPQEAVNIVSSADGMYMTGMIAPGRYRIVQVAQPEGYFDGLDSAGTVNGQPQGSALNPGDAIESIELGSGETGMDFNFGELRPASIAGLVHADLDGDCLLDDGEQPIAGVQIELLDEDGQVVATTRTGADGRYLLDGLRPGRYHIREVQPAGFFQAESAEGDLRFVEVASRRPPCGLQLLRGTTRDTLGLRFPGRTSAGDSPGSRSGECDRASRWRSHGRRHAHRRRRARTAERIDRRSDYGRAGSTRSLSQRRHHDHDRQRRVL